MIFIHAVGVFRQIKCQEENYDTNIQPYVPHSVGFKYSSYILYVLLHVLSRMDDQE